MPSASGKLEKQASMEALDPMKQIVTIVEKKVRNLEKRKGKLDSYRHDSETGKELNEDQKKAVEKYDQVVELLDFAKDLQKQFNGVFQETSKAQKKEAKREQLERKQMELMRIKDIMLYQDLLSSMGEDEVRQDFLAGNKGAVKLSEDELNSIDELYKIICPERDTGSEEPTSFDSLLSASSEHIQALLDGKNSKAFGTTYKSMKETLQKIVSCSYFSKNQEPSHEQTCPEEKVAVTEEQGDATISEADDYVMVPKKDDFVMENTPSQLPYYPLENSSLYSEQTRPIQEVLSEQGNLNFLQESQIEVEQAPPPTQSAASYGNVQFSQQPISVSAYASHPRHISGETPKPSSLTSPPGIPPPPGLSTNKPSGDFDRSSIPSQTYTNQSFHPLMAVAPGFGPVVSQAPLPQRPVVQAPVSGVSPAAQANVYSLLKMNQLNADSSQASHLASRYEGNQVQDNNVNKHVNSYGNGSHTTAAAQDRSSGRTYQRGSNPVDFGSDQGYQSTNSSQAYASRESFADPLSYSSNLKRGLTSRGGSSRGAAAPRGGTNQRRGRVPSYRS